MRDVTVVMAYYENPNMLQRQLANFAKMRAAIKEHLEYVIVDDGSPKHPAGTDLIPIDYKLQIHRMGVDIRWNQDACRNLGAKEARHKWLLLTDMDHLIPEGTLGMMMDRHLNESSIYKFSRLDDETFEPYKPHPNSWFMTKDMYFKVGGYDERFAGLYGTDWDFRDRCVRTAEFVEQVGFPLIRVGREHTADASCPREFGRKSPADAQAIRAIRDARGKQPPQMFRFPHHMVLSLP